MRSLVMLVIVLNLHACAKKEAGSASSAGSGSAAAVAAQPAGSATTGSAAPAGSAAGSAAAQTGSGSPTAASETAAADEIAQLVVHDVASNAFGNQTIEASCVSVILMPAGDWTVAAARLKDCGDKTARSILWLYKRGKQGGKWTEDYLGQPPRCWKGVPPDLAEAVSKATKIPSC
jgi:hypothetical protein